MALAAGTRLDHYEILAPLGAHRRASRGGRESAVQSDSELDGIAQEVRRGEVPLALRREKRSQRCIQHHDKVVYD
jgi:hypothetical protein